MKPDIRLLKEKYIIGQKIQMSYADNRTIELWENFMPRQKEINNKINEAFYSMQNYPPSFFENYNPTMVFEKWAAVEVFNFQEVPTGLKTLILPSGLYAVWLFKGTAKDAPLFFENLFKKWLPESGYQLENRFHFEILGEKYKRDDPDSEEEVWIPVRPK